MKKILIAFIVVLFVGAVSFAGYRILTVTKEIEPEALLPQDMSLVISIDHSDPDQVELMKDIISRVPSFGIFDDVLGMFGSTISSPFTYEENKELIEGSWKVVLGIKLPADSAKIDELLQSPNLTLDSGGIDIYFAIKTDEPDRIKVLLDDLTGRSDGGMVFVGTEEDPVWEIKQETGSILISKYGNIYYSTTTSAQKDAILKRIDMQEGFDQSPGYKANMTLLGEENLGYLFVDGKLMLDVWKKLLSSVYEQFPMEVTDVIGNIWCVVSADEQGIKAKSKVYLVGDENLINKYYPTYKLGLIKKVPSKGVFVYMEMPSLGVYLDGFLKGMTASFSGASVNDLADSSMASVFSVDEDPLDETLLGDEGFLIDELSEPAGYIEKISREKGYKSTPVIDEVFENISVAAPESKEEAPMVVDSGEEEDVMVVEDLYGTLLEQLSSISGLSEDDVSGILDNPYAFSMSDVDGYIPTMSFYLELNLDVVENAKKLVTSLATYIDQVLAELNAKLAGSDSQLAGIIKKEVKIVDGAGIQRVYVDLASLPQDKILALNAQAGIDVAVVKVELYYGILNDGTFVFAFYPDFVDEYGKDPISDAGYYKEMVSEAGDFYGRTVNFVRTDPILKIAERYFNLWEKVSGMGEDSDIFFTYEMYTKLLSAFKYMFSSDSRDGDGVINGVTLEIEKVEISPKLKERIEADKLAKKQALEAQQKAFEEMMNNPEKDEVEQGNIAE